MQKSKFERTLGKVVARKYTVMMNSEPIDLYIKGDKIKQAQFLGRKIDLNLSKDAIDAIKSHPTRLVNGNSLVDNKEFTRETSKMMSSHLHLAIQKRDMKTLSRFAQSNLVPDSDKQAFIEAINRPRGLRRVLNAAVQKTNNLVQNMANKIDRYFERMQDKLVNNKLDEHLSKYQTEHLNKAPLLKDLDINQNLDPRLRNMARDFYTQNHHEWMDKSPRPNPVNGEMWIYPHLQEQFYQQAAAQGFSVTDAKTALAKELHEQEIFRDFKPMEDYTEELKRQVKEQEKQIVQLKTDLGQNKNESLEDFIAASKNLSQEEKIDLLVENKDYQVLAPQAQKEIENKHIFKQEPIEERAQEVRAISKQYKELDNTPEVAQQRSASINFKDPAVKEELKSLAVQARHSRDDSAQANIAAVQYNGISKPRLEKWKEAAVQNKAVSPEFADKLIDKQLSQALKLAKAGVLKEQSEGVYKFKDNFAKETLMRNYNKPIEKIAEANQGKSVELPSQQKEIFDRVKSISSEQSFQKMLDKDGNLKPEELREYAKTLEAVSLQIQEKANRVEITREDLRQASQQTQSQQHQQERA